MPPLPAINYLITWLFEIGPTLHTGMGAVNITWQEIEAWNRLTEHRLTWREAEIIHRLSKDYASQYELSKESDALAPFVIDVDEQRNAVHNQLKAILDAMVAKQKK